MSKANKKIKEKSEKEKSNLKVILENCSGDLLNSNKETQIKSAGITLIALVITILFSYDEKIKCSNSKGFLLLTI